MRPQSQGPSPDALLAQEIQRDSRSVGCRLDVPKPASRAASSSAMYSIPAAEAFIESVVVLMPPHQCARPRSEALSAQSPLVIPHVPMDRISIIRLPSGFSRSQISSASRRPISVGLFAHKPPSANLSNLPGDLGSSSLRPAAKGLERRSSQDRYQRPDTDRLSSDAVHEVS